MIARLQTVLGRTSAVAILLALIACGIAAIALPYVNKSRALAVENEVLHQRLSGLASVAQTRSHVEAQLARLEQGRAVDDSLLEGESAALSGAKLQERLTRIINVSGGRVKSSQMLPSSEESGLEKVMVRMQFQAGMIELQRALLAIEASRPLLFVHAFNIAVNRGQQKRVQSDKSEAIEVSVSLDLFGYRRKGVI